MLSPVDCQDDDVISGYAKVHGVWKPIENRSPRFSSDQSKLHRAVADAFDRFVQRCAELGANPGLPTFVPVSRFECFGLSLRPEADAVAHSRSSSFRRTSSHGMADSGR